MTVFLEPCPFCGCELSRTKRKANPRAYCATEGCYASGTAIVLDDPAQVAAWNRRMPRRARSPLLCQSIETLRTRLANATPGPWMNREQVGTSWATTIAATAPSPANRVYASPPGGTFPGADLDLIIAARNLVPALLDAFDASDWRDLPDDPSESCDAFDGKPCIIGGWNDGTWTGGEAYYNAEREGWWWAQTHDTDHADGQLHFTVEYWMPLPGAPAKEVA